MRNAYVLLLTSLVFSASVFAAEPLTRNVVFVTLDGVLTQEIFGSMDSKIAAHSAGQVYSEIGTARQRFWAEAPLERRELLADLWTTLEAHPAYGGKTTLIVTTDHGRGLTPTDWA